MYNMICQHDCNRTAGVMSTSTKVICWGSMPSVQMDEVRTYVCTIVDRDITTKDKSNQGSLPHLRS